LVSRFKGLHEPSELGLDLHRGLTQLRLIMACIEAAGSIAATTVRVIINIRPDIMSH